jgi:hypothetical protein
LILRHTHQHRSLLANQWKKLDAAQVLQMSFQERQEVEPWNMLRSQDFAAYTPFDDNVSKFWDYVLLQLHDNVSTFDVYSFPVNCFYMFLGGVR